MRLVGGKVASPGGAIVAAIVENCHRKFTIPKREDGGRDTVEDEPRLFTFPFRHSGIECSVRTLDCLGR